MFYFVKNPRWLAWLFPKFVWRQPSDERILYLTFDDGPIPEVTPFVLENLARYGAQATFFVVGDNVRKHPQIFEQLRAAGHAVGNHTFNHLNGWQTDRDVYLKNVEQCNALVPSPLFRPPYGKLTPAQASFLKKKYRIVLWDVLAGDFDTTISKEKCLENVLKNISSGSIVVLHDSLKAEEKLRFVLPRLLEKLSGEGWRFERLNDDLQLSD